MTVADYWRIYREDLGDRPAAKTLGYTAKPVLGFFGKYRPDQIDRKLCRDYAAKREKQGRKQGTIHTELGHLRSALRFSLKAAAPDIWRPAKPSPKERYLTTAEIENLLDNASAPHIRLAIHLMLATAGRVGAILDLTWDRVDFERGQINLRITDSVTRKGRAIVPMNRGLRAALQTAHAATLSDYVVEHAGGPVKSIRKGVMNAYERAGIEGATLHTLRHSAAVHMIAAGVPIEKVGQYLGHSNVAVTYSVYARYAPDHLRDASEVLEFTRLKSAK